MADKSIFRRVFGRIFYGDTKNPNPPTRRTIYAPFGQEIWDEAEKIVAYQHAIGNRDVVYMVALGIHEGQERAKRR